MLVYKTMLKLCIIIKSNSQKTFFAIVLYTKMAAVTSRENRDFWQERGVSITFVVMIYMPWVC